jgi:hypothetical protein
MKITIGHHRKALGLLLTLLIGICGARGTARLMTPEQAQEWQKEEQKEQEVYRQSNDFDHSNDRATLDLLQKLKIDGVDWANRDLQGALNDLAARASGAGAAPIKFIIHWPKDPRQLDTLGRSLSRDVSFATNEKMSLMELLTGVVCRETNLSFRVEQNQVTFMPWQSGNFVYLHAIMDPM